MTDEEQTTHYAQEVVTAYLKDLKDNGPIDITSFTDSVLLGRLSPDDLPETSMQVDAKAIAIIRQIAKDLLTP